MFTASLRICTAAAILSAFAACQSCSNHRYALNSEGAAASITGTQKPLAAETVPEAQPATQSPGTPALPETSPIFKTTPTKTGAKPNIPAIVLYKNVVAGDYSILNITKQGQIEFTSYNRLNQVTDHRRSEIDPEDVGQLTSFIEDNGFYELGSEYDIYPLDPDDTMVYEDIYYWLKLYNLDQESKTVVAHEKARPPELVQITDRLAEQISRLAGVPLSGEYIVAGDADILLHKRKINVQPVLELEEANMGEYPQLVEALNNPYSLVQIDDLQGAGILQLSEETAVAKEVLYQNKHYVVLLLKGQE